MKIGEILFILTAFSIIKLLILNTSGNSPAVTFPSLETPDIEFLDLSAGCGGFTDCIEYVGAVLYNIGAGVIFIVLFIIELLVYLFQLFGLIISAAFTGIEGAPFWVNALLTLPFSAAIAFILYKLIRSGKSES